MYLSLSIALKKHFHTKHFQCITQCLKLAHIVQAKQRRPKRVRYKENFARVSKITEKSDLIPSIIVL